MQKLFNDENRVMTRHTVVFPEEPRDEEGGRDVILYNVVRPYNLPVARGTVQTTNPSSTVGGIPLGIQYCEVVVNHVFVRDAILPRPYRTLKSVGDARGRCIARPHDRFKDDMKSSRLSKGSVSDMIGSSSSVADDEAGQQSSGSQPLNLSDTTSLWFGQIIFSSSMGQLFQLHTWNSSFDRLPRVISQRKKRPTTITLGTVLGSVAATVATAAVVYSYFNSKYRGWKKELDQLSKSMQRLPGMPTQFSFNDIQKATNNFHRATKLGRGGFGTVYRCRLSALKKGVDLEVAVKKFSRDDNRCYEDFLAEVSVINRLRHKNIVPLVGWSYDKGEPILIYEYMPNGSLDQHLFPRSGGVKQQQQQPDLINRWDTRYNMVKDIATGLHYLHHEYEPTVLHRDIKANNIMVDSTFQGRLGDFGLACVVPDGKNSYTDTGAPETLGFRAPEFIQSGKATTKSDIFAFGVLILEIVTGKVAVDVQFRHLTDCVWHLHKEGRLLNAVDSQLTMDHESDDEDAKRLLLLGLACSQPNPSDRPNMVDAVKIITKLAPPPDVPLEKPRFVWPPEEGHSLNSDYTTELSSFSRRSLTIGIEMTAEGIASSENEANTLHHTVQRQGHHMSSSSIITL